MVGSQWVRGTSINVCERFLPDKQDFIFHIFFFGINNFETNLNNYSIYS